MFGFKSSLAGACCLAALAALPAQAAPSATAPYRHVLLISIDGMHGIDLQNFIADPAHAHSTLTALSKRGTIFQQALTSAPSDSFPGMIAQVTGATPYSADIFYDDSYDRSVYPAGSGCVQATGAGAETDLSEALDYDSTRLDAGGTLGKPLTQIDPFKLPLSNATGACLPVYPHQFLKVNTVFEVAKAAGMRTAWSDKHPAYEILNGPSGHGIDDLYTPEINSNNILGGSGDNTKSFNATVAYDRTKVQALLREIDGLDSTGVKRVGMPAIFGMNFQAVSVGQKLAGSGSTDPAGLVGGYADAAATPNNALNRQLLFVDRAIGRLVDELRAAGHYDDTLIIISAKHGQSPIDPALRTTRDDSLYFPQTPGYAFEIADDEVLLWLLPSQQKAQSGAAYNYLKTTEAAANLQALYPGVQLKATYKSPLTDPRTPDFIGVAVPGTIYTTGSKLAEHGGFADDDRHVALLVSGSGVARHDTQLQAVNTTQIAPTILMALGLAPSALQGVQIEHTQVLPGVFR